MTFQSTLPLRGATRYEQGTEYGCDISIHAPLAGSDDYRTPATSYGRYFNPRSPCGERRQADQRILWPIHISIHAPLAGSDGNDARREADFFVFQSTLPLRGATCPP